MFLHFDFFYFVIRWIASSSDAPKYLTMVSNVVFNIVGLLYKIENEGAGPEGYGLFGITSYTTKHTSTSYNRKKNFKNTVEIPSFEVESP